MRDLYLPRLHERRSSLPRVISFASSIPAAPLDEAYLMMVGRRSQFASTPSDRFFRWCFFRILPRGRRLPNCFSGFCANICETQTAHHPRKSGSRKAPDGDHASWIDHDHQSPSSIRTRALSGRALWQVR